MKTRPVAFPANLSSTAANSVDLPSSVPADNSQWIHVLPAGKTFGRDGRGPYELRDADAVMAATQQFHGRTKMMVDYEHQSLNAAKNGQPAPAAGWIVGLQKRADGIWAKAEWTSAAATSIREKAYRYLSPVFKHSREGEIGLLVNIALTNTPNLDLTALASVEFTMDYEKELAKLRALLGLAEDADMQAILDAITALQTSANSAAPDPAQYVPIGDFERVVRDANSLRQGVTKDAAVAHVAEQVRNGRLAPFMQDWAISLCTTNKPAFDSFMDRVGPAFNHVLKPSGLGSREPRGSNSGNSLTASELAVCTAMGLTTEEFMTSRGRD